METGVMYSFVKLTTISEIASAIIQENVSTIHELQQLAELRQGWQRLSGWENLEDPEILRLVLGDFVQNAEIYIVSDLSYQAERGAFCVSAGRIVNFLDYYFESFGEALFDGDVLLVSPSAKNLWIFHHEGMALQWHPK